MNTYISKIKPIFVIYIVLVFIITQLPVHIPSHIDFVELREAIFDLTAFEHCMYNFVPLANIDVFADNLYYARDFQHVIATVYNYFRGFVCNIVLFIPMGFLLPIIIGKYSRCKNMLILSLLFSIGIEFMQLVQQLLGITSWRVTDIDDVIANVIGALLGLFFYKYLGERSTKKTQ